MQLTIRDAAKLLNVSESMIYRWTNSHELPAETVNGQLRFNRAELLEWATGRRLEILPVIFQAKNGGNGPEYRLDDAMRRGGIHGDLPGVDKEAVLKEMTRRLPLPPECNRDFLFQVLMSREAVGSTYLGDGIAFPHPRYPLVLPIEQPFITLCFLRQPVRYSSANEQTVHTLFALISPTVREHLNILARLAFA